MNPIFETLLKPADMKPDDTMQKVMDETLAKMSDDMKLCLMAHVPIEVKLEGDKITIRTKHKVSILRMPDGKPYHILIGQKA